MAGLVQLHHAGGEPQLAEVLSMLGLCPADVDTEFGVVATDPRAGLFVVRVEERALDQARAALAGRPPHPAEGVFGDPRIEPTG
jgi:hypothetical protein